MRETLKIKHGLCQAHSITDEEFESHFLTYFRYMSDEILMYLYGTISLLYLFYDITMALIFLDNTPRSRC